MLKYLKTGFSLTSLQDSLKQAGKTFLITQTLFWTCQKKGLYFITNLKAHTSMDRKEFTIDIIADAFNTLTTQEDGSTTPITEITWETINRVENFLKNTYDKRYRLYLHNLLSPTKCIVRFAQEYYKVILTNNHFNVRRGRMYKYLKF